MNCELWEGKVHAGRGAQASAAQVPAHSGANAGLGEVSGFCTTPSDLWTPLQKVYRKMKVKSVFPLETQQSAN